LRKGITEGISLPGIGHQILSKELVDEAIIISDMYDLNEFIALDLLCTGKPLTTGFLTFPVLV
jgi:nuclear pore complex protein Nup205